MILTEKNQAKLFRYIPLIFIVSSLGIFSYLLSDVIIILMIAILIGMVFNPIVNFIEKRGFNRLSSVLIVYATIGIILIFGLTFIIPKIAHQLNTITDKINQANVNQLINTISIFLKKLIPFLNARKFSEQITNILSNNFTSWLDNLSEILSGIFNVLALLFIIPFITFFLLKDHKTLYKNLINLMPNRYFEMAYFVLLKIKEQLGRYVSSWILDAFLVALMSTIGLTILGIENSITIGLIAGLGHLIPFFGPVIGGLPAIIISLIQFGDFSMFIPIVVMFIIIYVFDNGFIQPHLFSKSTEMHPLMIILLVISGSKLFGIAGMLLAVPVATVIKTAAREIYFGYKNYKLIKVKN